MRCPGLLGRSFRIQGAVDARHKALDRNILSGTLDCLGHHSIELCAAGHGHVQHSYVPDLIGLQDLGQLANEGSFLVQLRAAYQGHAAFEEVLLDGWIGKCGAVAGHKETCPFEVRRRALHQPHLNRPAAELV